MSHDHTIDPHSSAGSDKDPVIGLQHKLNYFVHLHLGINLRSLAPESKTLTSTLQGSFDKYRLVVIDIYELVFHA